MSRTYYAFEHTYGLCTNEHGQRIGDLHAFGSAVERDRFVADGPNYRNEAGYRQALTRRQVTRREAQGMART